MKFKVLAIIFFMFEAVLPLAAQGQLSKEQINSLFVQANDAFRKANEEKNDSEQMKLYEQAILGFEKIINDGGIKSAGLYYNLANAYFLKQDIGRAILNYRRAENIDGTDTNISKNLSFARSRRIDKFPERTQQKVLKTLFFWHYDFGLKTRYLLTCIFFGSFFAVMTVIIWIGRKNVLTVSAIILGILLVCFLASVLTETAARTKKVDGVIIASEVVARQGDAESYPASFKEPLHSGAEFEVLEKRTGWMHIRLPDDSDTWIPADSSQII